MALKQDFAKQIESQIAGVAGADQGTTRSSWRQAGAEAKANYEKAIAALRDNAEHGEPAARAGTRRPTRAPGRTCRRRPQQGAGAAAARAGPTR